VSQVPKLRNGILFHGERLAWRGKTLRRKSLKLYKVLIFWSFLIKQKGQENYTKTKDGSKIILCPAYQYNILPK
jgi:hypothetical protein